MNKKILYISYDGLTDPLGQSQILPYLQELTKEGYEFTILSFEKEKLYDSLKEHIKGICKSSNITWVPLPFHAKPPLLSKWYDRKLMISTAKKLHSKNNFSLLHCRSYVAAEVGLLFKKKYKIPFIFDMRGFWADEKIDGGNWPQNKLIFRYVYNFYKRKEKDFLKNAAAIISLTTAAKTEMEKWPYFSTVKAPVTVIPCCADLSHFNFEKIDVQSQRELRNKLNIRPDQPVLTYSGSLGTWYMMNEMLQFFKQYLVLFPNAVFLCLTKEPETLFNQYAHNNNIPLEKTRYAFASRQEMPLYLSLSKFGIFFIRPTYSKISSSPIKHPEIMGLGIPVICNDIGDTGNIILKTKTGFLVNDFTLDSYNKTIFAISNDQLPSKMAIRESAAQEFSLQNGINQYKKVYKSIFDQM